MRAQRRRISSACLFVALAAVIVAALGSGASSVVSALGGNEVGPATVDRAARRGPRPLPTGGSFLSGQVYETGWNVNAVDGWSNETSGDPERLVARSTHLECHAGGNSAGTHYARVRRKLPERDGVAIAKRFTIEATFELPADFYDRHQSYMRLITTDNYPGKNRSNGSEVGTSSPDEWRVGFTIYGGDGMFRLISDHENHSNIVLWKAGSRLPVGRHTVTINFAPSRSSDGAWELFVDGARVGGAAGVQTVPSSVKDRDIVVTRVGGCIDGASQQDDRSIRVDLHALSFRGEL